MAPKSSKRSRAATVPSLNLDVLGRVLHYLSIADLKRAAVVSHAMHEEAIRELLTRGVRFDGSPTKLKSFCRFMLRRNPPLFPLLRSFEIVRVVNRPCDDFDPDELLKVLSKATYISNLRIHWPEKDGIFTLAHGNRLATIISNLQSLRRLQLGDVPRAAHRDLAETLLNLQSQLHELHVVCDSFSLHDELPADLGAHQTQLRFLRVFYPDLTRTPWAPLPSVQTLVLLWPESLPLSLRHIVGTFPALRELFICVGLPGKHADIRALPAHQAATRAEALEFQSNASGSASASAPARWESLDVLSTSTIAEAWLLGLACRVGALRLGAYDADRHSAFVDVVARVRPTKIVMALECAAHCVHPEVGPRIFLSPLDTSPVGHAAVGGFGATGAVTHAVVFFVASPGGPEEVHSTSAIVDTVGSHLKHSALEYLHLVITTKETVDHTAFAEDEWGIYERALRPRRQGQAASGPVPRFHQPPSAFAEIDIALLVSGVAGAGPSLDIVALTITERGQSVWRITRDWGGQMLSRITDPELARSVIAWEEHSYMDCDWES